MKKETTGNITIDFSREKIEPKVDVQEKKTNWGNLVMAEEEEKVAAKEITTNSFNYVVLDLETTGLEPNESRITEIVAIRYNSSWDRIRTVFHNLLNPSQKIPKMITDITGISDEMVKYKPYSTDGVDALLKDINLASDILVAHNASFEVKWLKHTRKEFGLASWICTRAIYLYMRDGNTWENNFKRNYSKLKQVCEYYGVEYKDVDAHRAEYDVLKTVKVAEKMIGKLGMKLCVAITEAYVNGKGFGKRKPKEVEDKGGLYD